MATGGGFWVAARDQLSVPLLHSFPCPVPPYRPTLNYRVVSVSSSLAQRDLRMVNTVLQHEIIQTGRIIYMKDEYTIDLFEMIVMSLYQKLNEERAGILKEIYKSGRILNV